MDELIKPNWHVALVHFPIALLVLGTLVEVFSFLGWRRGGLRWAGRWMVLFGAIASVPAAFSGLYAMGRLLPEGIAGLDAVSPEAGEMVRDHLWLNVAATGLAMLLVTFWIGFSDRWRGRLGVVFKLGLLAVVGLVLAGSWHGGEMVYVYQIGPGNAPTSLPSALPPAEPRAIEQAFAEAFPLVQAHVVVAGLAVALACVALGFSARQIATSTPARAEAEDEGAAAQRIALAFSQDVGSIAEPRRLAMAEQIVVRSTSHTPPVRAWPIWLLASLLLIAATVGGLWTLAYDLQTWDAAALRSAIAQPIADDDPPITRRLVHTIAGVVIVADALLLTILAIAAPRNRLLLALFAVPLVLAMVVQVWVGALLVLDGPMGKTTELSRPL